KPREDPVGGLVGLRPLPLMAGAMSGCTSPGPERGRLTAGSAVLTPSGRAVRERGRSRKRGQARRQTHTELQADQGDQPGKRAAPAWSSTSRRTRYGEGVERGRTQKNAKADPLPAITEVSSPVLADRLPLLFQGERGQRPALGGVADTRLLAGEAAAG